MRKLVACTLVFLGMILTVGRPGPAAADGMLFDCKYEVLLDTDNNPATGCDVHVDRLGVADQVIHGIDQAVIATVDRSVNPPVVNALAREVCAGGSLGAPIFIPITAWNVGEDNGTDFGGLQLADVVEGFVPLADLGNPKTVRAVFVSDCAIPATDFVASPNGDPAGPPILFDLVTHVPIQPVHLIRTVWNGPDPGIEPPGERERLTVRRWSHPAHDEQRQQETDYNTKNAG